MRRMGTWRVGRSVVGLCAALLLIAACESSPPDIVELDLTLYELTDRELGRTYEVVSLFVNADDLDGLEDLDRLYLIHDDAELFWSTGSDSWLQQESADGAWVGAPRLAMPNRAAFPAGTYRVVLVDVAGESAERQLSLPRRRSAPPPARVTVEGNRVTVAGEGAHRLWLVGAAGLAGVAEVDGAGEVNVAELAPAGRAGGRFDIYVVTRAASHPSQAMIGPFDWGTASDPGVGN